MSNLSAVQLAFLQRLHTDKPAATSRTQVALYFHEHFSLGHLAGRSIGYSAADHAKAAQLLRAHGQSITPQARDIKRAESRRPGLSEKTGSSAPHADSLAIKCGAGLCTLGDEAIPSIGYCVLTLEQACNVHADRILVVENLETFRDLANASWIDYGPWNVLAVFRGDTRFKGDEVMQFLQERREPVWAFMDFDPAGLGLASQLPRLERLILPGAGSLRSMVERAERRDLYVTQLSQWRSTLDGIGSGPLADAWRLMKLLQSGLPQEHMNAEQPPSVAGGWRHG